MLLVVLTLVLVWAGGAFGGSSGMTMALILAVGMNFFAYWFSDRVILRIYRAVEVKEADEPSLYALVRRLASKAAMPMPRLYMIDSEQPNAFATGRNPEHAAVAVTRGLLNMLSSEELSGVIGHELAHVKHRDILVGTVAATIAGAVSYLAQMAQWAMIFGRHNGREGNPLAALVMMIVAPIAALVVQLMISRSREYAADMGGARIAGNPMYLASALRKLGRVSKAVPMRANPATSHMFIVNPLRPSGLSALFSTHPPIQERVRRLENMGMGS